MLKAFASPWKTRVVKGTPGGGNVLEEGMISAEMETWRLSGPLAGGKGPILIRWLKQGEVSPALSWKNEGGFPPRAVTLSRWKLTGNLI